MLATVQLNDQLAVQTNEVDDVAREPMLTAELEPELVIAQPLPNQGFCIGLPNS